VGRVNIGVEGAFEASRSQRWAALAVLAEFSERPGTFDRHVGAQFASYLRIVHVNFRKWYNNTTESIANLRQSNWIIGTGGNCSIFQ